MPYYLVASYDRSKQESDNVGIGRNIEPCKCRCRELSRPGLSLNLRLPTSKRTTWATSGTLAGVVGGPHNILSPRGYAIPFGHEEIDPSTSSRLSVMQ